MSSILIRTAGAEDVPLLQEFIHKLARYEKLENDLTGTEEDLRKALFGPEPCAYALLGYLNGAPAGFAIYFFLYSTFRARRVLYLEDLFVNEEMRGRGLGKRFFAELLRIARERDCARFEWSVLDWNRPSIEFYERLGARPRREWIKYVFDRDQILALASSFPKSEIDSERENRPQPDNSR